MRSPSSAPCVNGDDGSIDNTATVVRLRGEIMLVCRTVGLAISPYIRRGTLDSTLYTTSAMLRTIELLLGLPPMSQYDAAATPMYKAFGAQTDLTPYQHLKPMVDINVKNTKTAYGAKKSQKMDFSDVDKTPMFALNEIIWKSIKGADSEMPLPVHRWRTPAFDDKSR